MFSMQNTSEDLFACVNGPQAYKCNICNFTSDLKVTLIEHAVQLHNLQKMQYKMALIMRKFECKNCNLQTYSLVCFKLHRCKSVFVHFKRHLERYSLCEKVKWFYCEFCNYKSRYSGNIKYHLLMKHEDKYESKWFRCEHCDYKSKQKTKLDAHLKRVHSGRRNIYWFECEHCEYKSANRKRLKYHSLEQHGKHINQWINCKHCKYKTRVTSSIKQHMISKHTDPDEIKWFGCGACKDKFKQKGNLKQHLLTHHIIEKSTRKLFTCQLCDSRFIQKTQLESHVLTSHNGGCLGGTKSKSEVLDCEHCPYKTKRQDFMRTHLSIKH